MIVCDWLTQQLFVLGPSGRGEPAAYSNDRPKVAEVAQQPPIEHGTAEEE